VLLIGFGIVAGGIREPPAVWATIITRLLAGSLPSSRWAFAIGYCPRPNAAPAGREPGLLAAVLRSGFSFRSPAPGFRPEARALPAELPHYAQLAWRRARRRHESLGESLLWLGGYSALFLTLAVRFYRREERAKFA